MISIKENGVTSLVDFRQAIKDYPLWEKLLRKASSFGEVTLMKDGEGVFCLRVDFEYCTLSFSKAHAPEGSVEAVMFKPGTLTQVFAPESEFEEGGFYTSMDRACDLIEKYNGYVPVEPRSED